MLHNKKIAFLDLEFCNSQRVLQRCYINPTITLLPESPKKMVIQLTLALLYLLQVRFVKGKIITGTTISILRFFYDKNKAYKPNYISIS